MSGSIQERLLQQWHTASLYNVQHMQFIFWRAPFRILTSVRVIMTEASVVLCLPKQIGIMSDSNLYYRVLHPVARNIKL
jgi:hypothetical protein